MTRSNRRLSLSFLFAVLFVGGALAQTPVSGGGAATGGNVNGNNVIQSVGTISGGGTTTMDCTHSLWITSGSALGAPQTITLPSGCTRGQSFILDDTANVVSGSNVFTVVPSGSDTIANGDTTTTLNLNNPGFVCILKADVITAGVTTWVQGPCQRGASSSAGAQQVATGLTAQGLSYAFPPAGVNAQTCTGATCYTIQTSDNAKIVTWAAGTSATWTVPQATGSFATLGTCVINENAVSTTPSANGNVAFLTLTPTTSTIDGLSSIILGAQQGICFHSDGTNYQSAGITGPTTNTQVMYATSSDISGTYTIPPNTNSIEVVGCGQGGGGAGGFAASATDGSGGGGGADCEDVTFSVAAQSWTAGTTTIKYQAGYTDNHGAAGAVGTVGHNTCFGGTSTACTAAFIEMFGGGGGNVGGAAAGGGGGPGGYGSAGGVGTTGCVTAGIGASVTNPGQVYSSGCGGTGTTTQGNTGLTSGAKAGGGGSGGNGNNNGATGGTALGGSGGGAGSGAAGGTSGGGGTVTCVAYFPGPGGGGGGGNTTGTGGLGANGCYGGGGGAGGSTSGAGTGGAGGIGGGGWLRIVARR